MRLILVAIFVLWGTSCWGSDWFVVSVDFTCGSTNLNNELKYWRDVRMEYQVIDVETVNGKPTIVEVYLKDSPLNPRYYYTYYKDKSSCIASASEIKKKAEAEIAKYK